MVKRVLNVFYKEIRGLHQAAYILAFFTLASQFLAVVRDRLLAHQFGAGVELDIYYAAFRVPDVLYVLFASVLSVYVLLPFVNRASHQSGKRAGAAILSQMFTMFLGLYAVIALVAAAAAPWLATLLFPGFAEQSHDLLVMLMRILLLQPLLLGISSLFGVVTQLEQRFVLYALSPLLYNFGIIAGVVFLYPWFGLTGLAYGVVLGAIGHMLVQLPFVQRGAYSLSLRSSIDWDQLKHIALVAVPRSITLSLNQILLLFLTALASTMVTGSVSVLQFAFNLQSVPLAIIGMSYSVAAFPMLADLLSREQFEAFHAHVHTALRHIIFWAVPVTALVLVLRAQLVRVLLGSGLFNWEDTRLTAAALGMFVISLAAQASLLLLVRAFYAGGKTRLPLILTSIGVGISGLSAFILYQAFTQYEAVALFFQALFRLQDVSGVEVLMLPLGFTIGVSVQVCLMLVFLSRTFGLPLAGLGRKCANAVVAAVVGGVFAYGTLAFVVSGVNQETLVGIMLQGVCAGVAGVAGVLLGYVACRSPELSEVSRSFRSRLFKTDVVAPQQDVL